MELDPYHIPHIKNQLKRIKDLTVKPEAIKLLEGKRLNISLDDDFFYLTPKAKATKAKINKWNYIKL